jgi:hypothetical protein
VKCDALNCTNEPTECHGGEVWFCDNHFAEFRQLADGGKTWDEAASILCGDES